MITDTIGNVEPGDKIRFAEDSRNTHTVKRIQCHSWEHSLRIVDTVEDSSLMIPANCPIYVVQRVRPFDLPCTGCGNTARILFDTATGNAPRSVLCGVCPAPDTDRES